MSGPSAEVASVTISITTHNREDDLRRTLERLQRLQPRALEVIVCADGCRDGTVAMLTEAFPWVRLLVHEEGKGSVASRDEIIRAARGDLVLSLDDDSYPVEDDFLRRAEGVFAAHPEVGVLTFPQRSEEWPETLLQDDFGPSRWVGSFPNSGAMFRRQLYLSLPGYPGFFFHAYEEPDFALQVIDAGKRVLYYTGATIRHHFTQVGRNERRTHQRHSRNELWSLILRGPIWWLVPLGLYRVASQLRYACSRGWRWAVAEPLWWKRALVGVPTAWRQRQPVSRGAFREWLRLQGRGEDARVRAVPTARPLDSSR